MTLCHTPHYYYPISYNPCCCTLSNYSPTDGYSTLQIPLAAAQSYYIIRIAFRHDNTQF